MENRQSIVNNHPIAMIDNDFKHGSLRDACGGLKGLVHNFVKEIFVFGDVESELLLTIVIANYNGGKLFLNLLKQITKLLDVDARIVIVDNNSIDNSFENAKSLLLEALKANKLIKGIILIRLRKNFGPTLAYDLGVLSSKSRYLLLINNDILLEHSFSIKKLIELFERVERYGIGAMTVKICRLDNKEIIDSAGTLADKLLFTHEYGLGDLEYKTSYNKLYYVHSVPLVFSVMKREVFLKAGMLDFSYFAGYEDFDLSLRIQLLGLKLLYVPFFKIYHLRGRTSAKKEFKPLMAYLFARAHICNLLTYENTFIALLKIFVRGLLVILHAIRNVSAKILFLSFLKPLIDVIIKERRYAIRRRIYASLLRNFSNVKKRLYKGILPIKSFN